ncbi:MAG: CBS domain-containing protein [Desulfobacteraceae bacterium]|nr:CBS domain-containing protein [Desulfobacteraceae bacterium]
MNDKKVKDLMIPLSDYLTVSEEDTLENAIKILDQAQHNTELKYTHKALLVYDQDKNIIGKVSIFDILKALEPKYRKFEHPDKLSGIGLSRYGFNNAFMSSLLESHNLWDETLEELVGKAKKLKIKKIMYTPSEGDYVDGDAPVAEAVHQFILGCHQSLLVVKDEKVMGIIRLSDIFNLVCEIAIS